MTQSRILACMVVAVLLVGYALPAQSQTPGPSGAAPDLERSALAVVRDRAGQMWAVWQVDDRSDVELWFSRQLAGAWSAPHPLFHRPLAWDRSPSLAVAPDGTVWVAWSSSSTRTPGRSALYVSRWAGSAWSRPVPVPTGTVTAATEPSLAAGPGDTLWLAWVGSDGVDDEIWASRWNGEAWALPWQVSADDTDPSLYDRQPRLAVGSDDQPWLVWTAHQDGVDDEIAFSRWTGTRWSREQIIGRDDDLLDVWPSLALDLEGRPWVAWHAGVAGQPGKHRILVSYWLPESGSWAEEEIVSSPTAAAVDEVYPSLAPDRDGGMHVAWVARSAASTALAHAYGSAGLWSEPVVAHDRTAPGAVQAIAAPSGSASLLWLDAGARTASALQSVTVPAAAQPLDEWLAGGEPEATTLVPPIINRFLSFGDSITWGGYPVDDPEQPPFYPYPSRLEDILNSRIAEMEVINVGIPGEQVHDGKDRIDDEVSRYTPKYVLVMEGTNDVSHLRPPAQVYEDTLLLIDTARHAGVDQLKVMVATLPPRLDDLNDDTNDVNLEGIIPAAAEKNIPVCNVWVSFYDYVDAQGLLLRDIYYDNKHPDQEGLDLLARTWYNCLLGAYTWLDEETTPPTTWIEPLPPGIGCGEDIPVSWTGTDNMSWVTDYDVQVSLNGGAWTDWLTGVEQTSGTYPVQPYGTVVGFQVRGRDVVGNLSAWSAPAYTTVSGGGDLTAWIDPLPATQPVPFTVSWGGSGSCGGVAAYDVQYRIGSGGWVDWKYHTTDTSALFDPAAPQYGQVHSFRVWAIDGIGSVSPVPGEAQTIVARYTLTGWARNVRHQPVAHPQVSMVPAPALLQPFAGGGFAAYLADGGIFDLQVSRADLYGPLPAMEDVVVNGDVTGLTFVLPPADDAVVDGGFEAGSLSNWQLGGTLAPVLAGPAHTGASAVKLGGDTVSSTLSQVVPPTLGMSQPTLSFMVRLENAGAASSLEVTLATATRAPAVYTLPVQDATWTHAWYDLAGLAGQPLTLTFGVDSSPAILLDEVSLGSAVPGGTFLYLPLIERGR